MNDIVNIENQKYVLAENIYGKYYIPHEYIHRPCSKTLIDKKVWEYQTLKFIEYDYSTGDIIHAGTFFGDFLPFLSKIINKKNKVYAFEPIVRTYEAARLNIKLNDINNVRLFNNSLTDKNQDLKFITIDDNNVHLGGKSHVTSNNNFNEVSKGIKIDNFKNELENLSIIHLDVEGHEGNAILGAKEVIIKFRPTLILEKVPDDKTVVDFLEENGYRFYFKINSNHVLISKKIN